MTAKPPTFTPPPTELWYTRCPVPTASGIAIQNGWLAEEFARDGIAVQSLRTSSERAVRESHFTHTLENSFRQGGNGPAIYARSQGQDTVLLGLHWTTQYQGLLARPQSGIASLADLRGKRLALPRRLHDKIDFWRSISLQGYDSALRLAGLTLADVQLVELPVAESFVDNRPRALAADARQAGGLLRQHKAETVALLRGDVDVIFGHSVWGVALREQFDLHEVINLATHDDPLVRINNGQPKTLTVSAGLLREQPALVDRYVAQIVRAADWARHNEDQARRQLARETGSAEAWLDEGTGAGSTARLDISLDEPLFDALARRKDFLLKWGFIANDFDVRAWADPGPLQRARALLREERP